MQRPRSITLTALLLGWFGIASTATALMGTAGSGPGLPLPALLLGALAAFGLSSLACARALWGMQPAGRGLLLLVGAAGALLGLAMPLTLGARVEPSRAWGAGLTGAVLFGLQCRWQSRRVGALLAG